MDFCEWAGVLHAPKPRALPTELHPDVSGTGEKMLSITVRFILSQKRPLVKRRFKAGSSPADLRGNTKTKLLKIFRKP